MTVKTPGKTLVGTEYLFSEVTIPAGGSKQVQLPSHGGVRLSGGTLDRTDIGQYGGDKFTQDVYTTSIDPATNILTIYNSASAYTPSGNGNGGGSGAFYCYIPLTTSIYFTPATEVGGSTETKEFALNQIIQAIVSGKSYLGFDFQ